MIMGKADRTQHYHYTNGVKDEKIATGKERSIDGSVHILDLPMELLSTILHFTGEYKEIARLRGVCHRFDVVCCRVLLSAFYKIQVRLQHTCISNTTKVYALNN
jgi:hypothetical protein